MSFNARFVATLPAADLARAKAWYADKLGLNPSTEFPGGMNYTTPGGEFALYETTFAGTAQNTAATWMAQDFDAAVADLRARGVVFEEYELPGLRTDDGVATDTDGFKAAWFKDSEGNIHGVIQSRPTGTEELRGLQGTGTAEAPHGPDGTYSFDYEVG